MMTKRKHCNPDALDAFIARLDFFFARQAIERERAQAEAEAQASIPQEQDAQSPQEQAEPSVSLSSVTE